MSNKRDIRAMVRAHLAGKPLEGVDFDALLQDLLSHHNCLTCTIHRLEADGLLHLVAQRGIPEAIMDRVRVIPVGKGMAGLAAERREPVQMCNLQTDTSGDAKPGAKLTQMKGSIAVPMIINDQLVGVLGVAKPEEYEFTAAEIVELTDIACEIGKTFVL